MIQQIPSNLRVESLPFEFVFFGDSHHQETIYREKNYPYFLWCYIDKGAASVIINGIEYIAHENQCFLFFPNESHSYKAIEKTLTLSFIAFHGKCVKKALEQLNINNASVHDLSNPNLFHFYINKLKDYLKLNYDFKKLSVLCYEMIINFALNINKITQINNTKTNPIISLSIRLIEENFSNPNFSLDEISNRTLISKYHLERVFKKEIGQSIIKYLVNFRIIKAKQILKSNPSTSIKDVALLCGFLSPSYFIKVFKKNTSLTPEHYRKKLIY